MYRLTVGNYITSGSNLFFEDETVKVNGISIIINNLIVVNSKLMIVI